MLSMTHNFPHDFKFQDGTLAVAVACSEEDGIVVNTDLSLGVHTICRYRDADVSIPAAETYKYQK
jgi:hypothetical protein